MKKTKTTELEKSKNLPIIKAKKREHEDNLVMIDSKHNMETLIIKWNHLLVVVMANGRFEHFHNGAIHKYK